jgi:WD40 repeat protein
MPNFSLYRVGQPGVEFSAQHPSEDSAVIRILFVPKSAKLITLCDNNSLHLWRFRNANLELVKSYSLDGKLKKISCIAMKSDGRQAFVGTEGGNIYTLDIEKFEIGDKIIYLDVVLQKYKLNETFILRYKK